MKIRQLKFNLLVPALAVAFLAFHSGPLQADEKYKITIENLTAGQPFSPPVAATHGPGISMFEVGSLASLGLEAIAEDGNQMPMFNRFSSSSKVTDVVDIGMPLTPNGTSVGMFTDSVTFELTARGKDRLSFATMLICTNDGFTGLNGMKLPKGSTVRWINGYDAGTEDNTEVSMDIVDPCLALGPFGLAGDPNGNENAAVDTTPHAPIGHHPNIAGGGDLMASDHGWFDPVARVTITRISDRAKKFRAGLSGVSEVPMVQTVAGGRADFKLKMDELDYKLDVDFIVGVTQAHIHMGPPNANGPIVAFLFGLMPPGGAVHDRLAEGTLTEADLVVGPLSGNFPGFVNALRNGNLYVNVHTAANPSGEIRGQIGAR